MSTSSNDETKTLTELGPDQLRVLNTLVIVDNMPMFTIFRTVLEDLGIRNVVHGKSSQNVVECLMTEPIDLIIIDDMAPLDGVKFLKFLRTSKNKLPNALPVMFVTARAERERIMAARDAGASEIMLKPFTAAQLTARLETTVKKPRSFVESKAYVGPDRRRRQADGVDAERRSSENSEAPRQMINPVLLD